MIDGSENSCVRPPDMRFGDIHLTYEGFMKVTTPYGDTFFIDRETTSKIVEQEMQSKQAMECLKMQYRQWQNKKQADKRKNGGDTE